MNNPISKPVLSFLALILLVGLACNVGGSTAPTPTTEPARPQDATPPPAPTPTAEAVSRSVSNVQDVKGATVQIEAQGTFIDPQVGLMVNTAGRGSGFIIDPSGIAVTNNHVVTGAALLKVWVGGESQPRNARILGVSECSDLAVIDIEGDGYPFLEWYQDAINVGLDVFVAGYPLGDPEYTLTRGIVSKAQADGETNWASVDSVLEYDATTNPGNSGGPVVDNNGRVIAVHYAGNSGTRQAFGISKDSATRVIETLRSGKDVDSIGINGVAVVSEDGSLSGIWVSSVKSGSPADKAEVRAGDILLSMEGLVLATDGTMADYCDILRSHRPEDTLALEVMRFETGEVLEGQLNGRVLEPKFSFASQLDDQVGGTTAGNIETYSSFELVTDDFGAIQMRIPVEWSDVDGRAWVSDGEIIGSAISAAANLDNYYNDWLESGVFFGASDDLAKLGGYVQLLDVTREDFSTACENGGRFDYEDQLYLGKYDLWTNCGDVGTVFIVLSAIPKDNRTAFLILVEVQIVKDADLDALDHILSSFEVVGTLP